MQRAVVAALVCACADVRCVQAVEGWCGGAKAQNAGRGGIVGPQTELVGGKTGGVVCVGGRDGWVMWWGGIKWGKPAADYFQFSKRR